MEKVSRVLIIDDSAYVRKVITQMLSRSPFLEVVGIARDGREALELVEELKPDVVTLDLMMPNLDGVGFLKEQMKRRPIPAVIVSIASERGEAALNALEAGAVDFIQKPTALATDKVLEMANDLIEKVKMASTARLTAWTAAKPAAALRPSSSQHGPFDMLVIGISTGGPQALKQLIPLFPENFPVPIAVVMHMPVGYTDLYAQKLNELASLNVVEAKDGEILLPGKVILGQAGRHLKFMRRADGSVVVRLDAQPFDTLHRPSVDVMFQSAVELFKGRTLGVIMTGMGTDGQQGAAWIKAQGGKVFTEAEETCVVYGMPRSVDEAGLSDRRVRLDDMARVIMEAI